MIFFNTQALSAIGSILILAAIVIQVVVFRDTFQLNGKQWACAAIFPIIGLGLGFGRLIHY